MNIITLKITGTQNRLIYRDIKAQQRHIQITHIKYTNKLLNFFEWLQLMPMLFRLSGCASAANNSFR